MDTAIVSFGAVAAVFAGTMAYLITRNEMNKHLRDTRRLRRAALTDAANTAAFLLALAQLLAAVLPAMLRTQ